MPAESTLEERLEKRYNAIDQALKAGRIDADTHKKYKVEAQAEYKEALHRSLIDGYPISR